jgi:hypothetical protein
MPYPLHYPSVDLIADDDDDPDDNNNHCGDVKMVIFFTLYTVRMSDEVSISQITL